MDLTDRERAILDVERGWWLEPGTKEEAIRTRLRLSPTLYYRLLSALVDSPDAAAYDPLLVRRLRRDRHQRRRARFEGAEPGSRSR